MSIDPTWNAEKATTHLTDLRASERELLAVHEYLSNHADEVWREVSRKREQITYCEDMFSKPRRAPKETQ